MLSTRELKELLLLHIEGSTTWRLEKAEQYPNDAKRNIEAAHALQELYEYISSFPFDHPFILYYGYLNKHDELERWHTEIRKYGFQNKETPQEFIDRFLKKETQEN